MAWRIFLGFIIALALLTLGMFAFVLAVAPGQCDDPSCLAVQTYSPGGTVELPATVEATNSGGPAPPVAAPSSPAATGAASPAATGAASPAASPSP